MMLVDTSVWIDFFAARNTAQVLAVESSIDQRVDLCVCGVILTEVLQGIRDDKQYKKTEAVLSNLIYLPMDQSTFFVAANIYLALRSRGITISNSVDCLIAAYASSIKLICYITIQTLIISPMSSAFR